MSIAAAVALVSSACGGSNSSSGNAPKATGPAYEVTTANVSGLGKVLVNGRGYTLYVYAPDNHSSRSTCSGPCAAAWPPLVLATGVSSPPAGKGVKGSLLGTTTRSDGSRQVTYNGWPLYRWVNDTSPGQATGQDIFNLGGRWYALSPGGAPNQSPNPNGF